MIGIKSITPYFEGEKKSIKQLPEAELLSGEELEYFQTVGISSIHDSGETSSYELAKKAGEKLLNDEGLAASDLDKIIYIKSRTPDHFISSEATRLKFDLKADKALTYSLSDLGCADISMALKLARDFLVANRRAKNVLIVYGHKQFAKYRFRYPVTITGDGGVAVWVSKSANNQITDIAFDANGYYWDLFKIDYKQKAWPNFVEECSDHRKYGFELAIESKNRFEAINKYVLESNGLTKADINHYLLQNISKRAYEYYNSAFDISISEACEENLDAYGHLGPMDVMLNLYSGIQSGKFKEGERVLIMNNSPVAAWTSILIKI